MASQVTVKPEQLGKEIIRMLEKYTDEVVEASEEAGKKFANEGKQKLRATRSVKGSRVWKTYPSGWSVKAKSERGKWTRTIWNAKKPGLTHLLENGHVVKNGTGRNNGRQETRSFEHIAPVNKELQEKLEQAILEAIEKG